MLRIRADLPDCSSSPSPSSLPTPSVVTLTFVYNLMLSSFFQTAISVALLSLTLSRGVDATACIAFDSNFELYAFGFGGKDFQIGTQDAWSSSK